jgi:molybdate transport system substrate-binding protein
VAQVNVLISGGFSGAYEELLPEFERASGIKVATGSGASQGTGPQTIAAQLARGVRCDVVILSREGLGELIAAKRIVAGTDVDLARVPVGVAVRAGAPKPDVSTVEAFKQVLLKAKTIAVPGSTSGIWLTTELFSAARHRGNDQRPGHAPRHRRSRDGRRRRRGSCSLADE